VYASLTRCGVGTLAVGLVVGAIASAAGFQAPSATFTPDYQATGVIVALHPPPSALHATRPVIVVRHDPIVGLMDEAMEHPFIAASTALFDGFKPGDRVAFGLKSTDDALLVISLHRLVPVRRR
jgi:hypothetical protein